MTAEERMAYFQGTKRRNDAYPVKTTGKNQELIFLKMKKNQWMNFLICLLAY